MVKWGMVLSKLPNVFFPNHKMFIFVKTSKCTNMFVQILWCICQWMPQSNRWISFGRWKREAWNGGENVHIYQEISSFEFDPPKTTEFCQEEKNYCNKTEFFWEMSRFTEFYQEISCLPNKLNSTPCALCRISLVKQRKYKVLLRRNTFNEPFVCLPLNRTWQDKWSAASYICLGLWEDLFGAAKKWPHRLKPIVRAPTGARYVTNRLRHFKSSVPFTFSIFTRLKATVSQQ